MKKILILIISLFIIFTSVDACSMSREFYTATDKQIFDETENIIIWEVIENKSKILWDYWYKYWIVEFKVLNSIKWNYSEKTITIYEINSWTCGFHHFLKDLKEWEIYSLYLSEIRNSNNIFYWKKSIGFRWNSKYLTQEEAYNDLMKLNNMPLFIKKSNSSIISNKVVNWSLKLQFSIIILLVTILFFIFIKIKTNYEKFKIMYNILFLLLVSWIIFIWAMIFGIL
jgi:hypothetical protein